MTLAATRDFTSLSICADDAHEGMICGDLVPAHTTSAAERPHGRDDRRSWDAAYVLISPSISAAAFALRLGRLVRTAERPQGRDARRPISLSIPAAALALGARALVA